MHPYPHRYPVHASARPQGNVMLTSSGLPDVATAPPVEFGGPGDQWSPETLLVGAAADCFILSFRAVATASKLAWNVLSCDVEGVLDRVEGVTRFTEMIVRAHLIVPVGTDEERARRLLEKADKACLIMNSLKLTPQLIADIVVEAGA